MSKFNKTTGAVVSGAIITIIGAIWSELGPEVLGSAQTLITAGIVWGVPNA